MRRWWNRPRFDLVELVLVTAAASFVTFLALQQFAPGLFSWVNPEREYLSKTYGPARNSQYEEEWIVRDFFHDRRGGVFVDVGANHYRTFSNTYYLETALGWSGLAIDPQQQFEADYRKYRPKTRFFPFFISDVSNQEATLYYVKNNDLVTSSDRQFTEAYGKDAVELRSPTITLDDLFAKEKVTTIDFLSIDIELAEPKALKGFDVERFRPSLVCIEDHPEVRQQILDYFARHRYALAGKYLRIDPANLYFYPAG